MKKTEYKRLYRITHVFLSYGLDELIPQNTKLFRRVKRLRNLVFWVRNQHKELPVGDRLRLALQSLGPVWVKFGQMMSTRRDLFPPHIADPLALLQDQVNPFDGEQAQQLIEDLLGRPISDDFDDFDPVPLASASIAQVHTARLKTTDQAVVFKVIRPDIKPQIMADLALMYQGARWVDKWLPVAKRLKPIEVIKEYEKNLLDELDLRKEAANTIQLRRNFQDSNILYVPEVIDGYSYESLMVSERIYGIPVSDIDALVKQGTDLKLLAERGVIAFFTQVFRDSFFHADMHPGNVFVSYETPEDPKWIGIDCGIIGTLNREDQRYLAENFLAFFNRDYWKVAKLHVESGWVPAHINVEEFEKAIRVVCEPIFAKPLCDISFGHVLLNLFNTARAFEMEVQPQLVLLQKTLLYIEGLGRQLYPELDLWATAKPFLEDWMKDQIGPRAWLNTVQQEAPGWLEYLPKIPKLFYDNLEQGKKLNSQFALLGTEYRRVQKQKSIGRFWFGIGATLLICATILWSQGHDTDLTIVAAMFGVIFWLISWRVSSK